VSGALPDPETEFRRRCARDRARLAGLRDALTAPPADRLDALLAAVQAVAHGLYGAGGTFGFDEVSAAAATLEDLAEDLRAGDCRAWPERRAAVLQAATALLQALDDMRPRP
jgi:chemotaxis protein histidine kinase CheA